MGKLLTIDNQIDPSTGTAKLKAVFSNADNKLWPNQFVNADLLLEMRKNSTVVPTAAILRGPQGTYVYAVNPDKTVEDKIVTVALTQGDTTVVSDGVNPGDTVVTDGQDKLQRGSRIEPRTRLRAMAPVAVRSRGLQPTVAGISPRGASSQRKRGEFRELQVHESVTLIYSPAGRDHAADGGRAAGRDGLRSRSCRSRRCRKLIIRRFKW